MTDVIARRGTKIPGVWTVTFVTVIHAGTPNIIRSCSCILISGCDIMLSWHVAIYAV